MTLTLIYIVAAGFVGIVVGMVIEFGAEMSYIRRLEDELATLRKRPSEIIKTCADDRQPEDYYQPF